MRGFSSPTARETIITSQDGRLLSYTGVASAALVPLLALAVAREVSVDAQPVARLVQDRSGVQGQALHVDNFELLLRRAGHLRYFWCFFLTENTYFFKTYSL